MAGYRSSVRISGRVISVREAKGRHSRGDLITFDVDTPSSTTLQYEAGDQSKLFTLSKNGSHVDYYLCEGYFGKQYVCNGSP